MRSDSLGTTLTAATLGLVLAFSPAAGQEADQLQDGRWLPYLGCWVDVGAATGPMTCVVPEGEGVVLLTVEATEVTDRRVVQADGVERPVEVAGCTGVEAARFSSDGYRVYTQADMSCGGNVERQTQGLIAMVAEDQWIEARSLGMDDGAVAWVKRYRPAPQTRIDAAGLADRIAMEGSGHAVEAARNAASRISVEDIIEAHGRTGAEAVRAWIAEQGEPLRLDADRLVELADAGVPAEVIDVAIAVSFPERFSVGRQDPQRVADDRYGYGRWGTWGMWNPYYYDPFYYDPFYFRYNRYYGSGGYGYYGTRFYSYRPTVVIVEPTEPQPRGRVVNGRGYTRPGAGTGTATRRPSVIRPSSPSSSRVSGSGGYSSGSSSSGSKGKAKPKGGG